MIVRKIDLARALGVNRSTITKAAQAGRLVLAGDDPRFFDLDASLARFQATKGGRLDLQDQYAHRRAQPAPDAPAGPTAYPSRPPAPAAPHGPATGPTAALDPALTAPDGAVGHRHPPATAPGRARRHQDAPDDPDRDPTPPPAPQAPYAAPSAPDAALRPARVDGQDRTALQAARLAAENAITKMDLGLLKGSRLLLADVGRESQGLGARLFDHLHRVCDQFAARLAAAPDGAEQERLLRRELHQVARAFDRGGVDSLRRLKAAGRVGRGAEREGGR